MNKKLADHIEQTMNQEKITKEEIIANWEYYLDYLVDILNKDYDLDTAIEDLKGFRGSKYDMRDK